MTAGSQQTLPIFIYNNDLRPNQGPIVNVVAVLVLLLSTIAVYLASRLSSNPSGIGGRR